LGSSCFSSYDTLGEKAIFPPPSLTTFFIAALMNPAVAGDMTW
jgi:hypothetical protein